MATYSVCLTVLPNNDETLVRHHADSKALQKVYNSYLKLCKYTADHRYIITIQTLIIFIVFGVTCS